MMKAKGTLCQVAWCADSNQSDISLEGGGVDDRGKFDVVPWAKCLRCDTQYHHFHRCEGGGWVEVWSLPVEQKDLVKYYLKLVPTGKRLDARIRSKEGIQLWKEDGQQFNSDRFA